MANEAVLIFETEQAIPFTVANGTGIAKGESLKLGALMTASAATAVGDVFAGIAKNEKIASDGEVQLALYRGGIFKVSLSGSCSVGDPAVTSLSKNHFETLADFTVAGLSGSTLVGTFLDEGTTGSTIRMELRPSMGALGNQ